MADKPDVSSRERHHSRGVNKRVFFLSLAAMAVVGFAAGTRSNDIYAAVGPVFGIKVAAAGDIDLSTVQHTYRELAANFDGTLDTQKLIDGASRGLVAAAGDKYTVFMDASEAKDFDADLSGNIGGGIGAEIGVRDKQPTIIRILSGNPAEKAGLKSGDVVVAVNNESADGWTSEKTASKVRGEAGTTVKLTVMRDGEKHDFTVTRATVNNPSVYTSEKDGIGIMTITRFDGETGNLAKNAAQQFKNDGVKGVVLDVRNNGGGYLTAAQDVASLWLNDKVVVTEREGDKVVDELRSGSNALLSGLPTVVLVNGYSASASEIVSGALQDNGAATLVGEKTFGKGTVQKVLDLGAGTQLKVTVARWYTPKGNNITEKGITPDKKVVLSENDANSGNDSQLNAALEQLGG